MRSLLFSTVLICCAGLAAAQPLPPKLSQPARNFVAAPAVDEETATPVYYPARDPEAYANQACYDALESAVFGFTTGQEVWNLDLDAVVGDDNVMTGTSRLGLPFTVQFSSFISRNVTGDPSLDRTGTWTGLISGANGNFYCGGFYFENDGNATIVPYYARRDQADAAAVFQTMIETSNGHGYVLRQWQCALDSIATFQSQQNWINAEACADAHFNRYMGIAVTCTTVGMASCWWSFGIGCIGGLICDGTILIKDIFWQRSYQREWQRANSCLCLETSWRNAHPGETIPNSSCGDFRCPDSPDVEIPKLN